MFFCGVRVHNDNYGSKNSIIGPSYSGAPRFKYVRGNKTAWILMKVINSILEAIGNTPLLKLTKVTSGLKANVFAKCEFLNPSGSVKDRMALNMIQRAEMEGRLKLGGTIVESTTGNTGIALSFVASVKGYKAKLFVPDQWASKSYDPTERMRIANCFGAEIEKLSMPPEIVDLLKGAGGAAGGIVELRGKKKCFDLEQLDPMVWWARQVSNPYNAEAHEMTGREILDQTDGKVDAWVASIGTGGTLLGVARALKEKIPEVKIIGVEPENTPLTDWAKTGKFDRYKDMFGVPKQRGLVDDILDQDLLDNVIRVNDHDARAMANRLCREEGLFVGMSSGANVFAALRVAKELGEGRNVVTVLVDRRDRYMGEFSNELYVT